MFLYLFSLRRKKTFAFKKEETKKKSCVFSSQTFFRLKTERKKQSRKKLTIVQTSQKNLSPLLFLKKYRKRLGSDRERDSFGL